MSRNLTVALQKDERRENRKLWCVTLCLLVIVLILGIFMMTMGNTHYTLREVFEILQSDQTKGAAYTIKKLRLPKLLVGMFVGAGFGMSGYTFQNLLRNSLASPDIIGVTAGSSAAAVFALLILHLSGALVSIVAVVSGLLVTGLILYLSKHRDTHMILIGIGMQAFLNALISWMLLVGSEYDVASAMRWLRGSLNSITNTDVLPVGLCFLIGFVGLLIIQKPLQMMQMGEEYAVSLGVHTERVRLLALVFALILSAGGTAVTGPIASVAFLSAPIASRLTSRNKSALLTSGLVGSILVLAGELIGQNAFSTRFPVGVITGLLGAPYLLYLLYRMNRKEGA